MEERGRELLVDYSEALAFAVAYIVLAGETPEQAGLWKLARKWSERVAVLAREIVESAGRVGSARLT